MKLVMYRKGFQRTAGMDLLMRPLKVERWAIRAGVVAMVTWAVVVLF